MRKEFYRPGVRVIARRTLDGRSKSNGDSATVPEGSRGSILQVLSDSLLECEFTSQDQTIIALAEPADVAPEETIAR